MKIEEQLTYLKNIKTKSLANVMKISLNMARKYKREPWNHNPPTTKAVAVEEAFGLSVFFWRDVKVYSLNHTQSVTKNNEVLEVQKNQE